MKVCFHAAGSRPFHTTGTKQMGGGGGHAGHADHDNYDDYLHAEHMYNLPAMKNRTLKMGLAVFAVVGIGTAVPIVAVIFQQKKAKIM